MAERKIRHKPEWADPMAAMGKQIDRSISVCLRPRYNFGATPKLWEVAQEEVGRWRSLVAADRLLDVVDVGDTVILSTGWPIPPIYPEGEICGLAGVCSLARALT